VKSILPGSNPAKRAVYISPGDKIGVIEEYVPEREIA
jgi:hypothetical protein